MNDEEFKEECYRIGMKNEWCSGRAAMREGDLIMEGDRLNRDSFTVFEMIENLKDDFSKGNWCLGQAFIYNDLCFINQVDGGDEWLTMKRFADEVVCFNSITWKAVIRDESFENYFARLENATKQQCESQTY